MERGEYRPQSLTSYDTPTNTPELDLPEFAVKSSFRAFSYGSKRTMMYRAEEKHGEVCSEITGKKGTLHAAHFNHNRSSHIYDDPNNGVLVTQEEHLIMHLLTEGVNGLTHKGNRRAVQLLSNDIIEQKGEQYLLFLLEPNSEPYTTVQAFLKEYYEKQRGVDGSRGAANDIYVNTRAAS